MSEKMGKWRFLLATLALFVLAAAGAGASILRTAHEVQQVSFATDCKSVMITWGLFKENDTVSVKVVKDGTTIYNTPFVVTAPGASKVVPVDLSGDHVVEITSSWVSPSDGAGSYDSGLVHLVCSNTTTTTVTTTPATTVTTTTPGSTVTTTLPATTVTTPAQTITTPGGTTTLPAVTTTTPGSTVTQTVTAPAQTTTVTATTTLPAVTTPGKTVTVPGKVGIRTVVKYRTVVKWRTRVRWRTKVVNHVTYRIKVKYRVKYITRVKVISHHVPKTTG